MLKRSQQSIDPATQDYGTSLDDPGGSAQVIQSTPVGITGKRPGTKNPPQVSTPTKNDDAHTSEDLIQLLKQQVEKNRSQFKAPVTRQQTQSMRKSDAGVKVAMKDVYIKGFADKCAACGVDAEALVKQALGMPSLGSLKTLINPVVRDAKNIGRNLMGGRSADIANALTSSRTGLNAAMHNAANGTVAQKVRALQMKPTYEGRIAKLEGMREGASKSEALTRGAAAVGTGGVMIDQNIQARKAREAQQHPMAAKIKALMAQFQG